MYLPEDTLEHYRPNVGILLFNRHGKVWLGQRIAGFDNLDPRSAKGGFRWQMPQGGIDRGESVEQAAYRELTEETGITRATLLALTPGWLAYNYPPESRKKKWLGQRQKWAVMLFTGGDEEINLQADEVQEFSAWRWADLDELPTQIVPFKRDIYLELVRSFRPLRDYLQAEMVKVVNPAQDVAQ